MLYILDHIRYHSPDPEAVAFLYHNGAIGIIGRMKLHMIRKDAELLDSKLTIQHTYGNTPILRVNALVHYQQVTLAKIRIDHGVSRHTGIKGTLGMQYQLMVQVYSPLHAILRRRGESGTYPFIGKRQLQRTFTVIGRYLQCFHLKYF